MKTDDEGAPGQITSEQYRELRALFEYWFDRLEGSSSDTDQRDEPEPESREALRMRLLAQEERFESDVRRIAYLEAYHAKLRRDLRAVEPLLDCLESKALGRPPIHCGWDPLLTALEECRSTRPSSC